MLERLQRREAEGQSDDRDRTRDAVTPARRSGQRRPPTEGRDDEASESASPAFRLGRLVLGAVLAFTAFDNLRNLEERVAYADAKGAPKPSVTVPAASGLLQAGSVGVALWRLPSLSTAAVATFFAGVTPVMHDFWAVDDDQQRQQEMTHFLKNGALFGAALALFGLARRRD